MTLQRPTSPLSSSRRSQLLALAAAIAVVLITQVYYALTLGSSPHSFWVVVYGVEIPLGLGCILLLATGQLVTTLGYAAIFLSVVDDYPVLFDWPRFNSFLPWLSHDSMQVILYIASFVLLAGATGVTLWRSRRGWRVAIACVLLMLLTFGFCYADDIPAAFMNTLVNQYWYELDALEHIASAAVFGFMLFISRPGPPGKRNRSLSLDSANASN